MALLLDETDVPVSLARVRVGLRAENGRAARRNHNGRRCLGLARLDRTVYELAIVSAIGHDARDLSLDLLEQDRYLAGISGFRAGQHTRNDLACFGVYGQMQLTPGPAGSAVLFAIPFPFPEQLQARAVEQQVQGAVWGNMRPAVGEAATAPAQGGVVRNRELEPEQAQHAAGEALGLAQAQVEDDPQG